MNVLRKCRSALFLGRGWLQTKKQIMLCRIWGGDISFGTAVSVGRMVTIRTTDGGKIDVDDEVLIGDFVRIQAKNGVVRIGKGAFIGTGVEIVACNSISIGEGVAVAAYTIIRDADHGMLASRPILEQPKQIKAIEIGNDVWLGSHVTVTSGCKIGMGAVVGANAVVTKNIPQNAVAVGVPAKIIRFRVSQ